MHLLHISDTHGSHNALSDFPAADIVIHSGDITWAGKSSEVIDFIDWFCELDYRYKIFIAGNHDFILDGKDRKQIQRFLPDNCFYLCNSGVTIEGIKFWGVPFFFSEEVSGEYLDMMAKIPYDTDVLITHRPPHGILDKAASITFGCPHLLEAVSAVRPKYHLFGHIHDAHGIENREQTIFANASLMDESYQLVNTPLVFEI